MGSHEDNYFPNNQRNIPAIHPGLGGLIRNLGKQAHCASRTMILCEPFTSRYREQKYHERCQTPNAPKHVKSWVNVNRPTALWSPVRVENYYYDCYYYRQYPEREYDYKDIEEKYNAIKEQPMDYSPPYCEGKQTKAVVLDERAKHRRRTQILLNRKPRQPHKHNSYESASLSDVVTALGLEEVYKQTPSSNAEKSFYYKPPLDHQYGEEGEPDLRVDGNTGLKQDHLDRHGERSNIENINKRGGPELIEEDCVPYEDLAKLRNFKEITSRAVNSTLSSMEELSVALRKKLNEISVALQISSEHSAPPGNHSGDAKSKNIATLEEIINLIQSNDEAMVRRLLRLKTSSLKMNNQVKQWQHSTLDSKQKQQWGDEDHVEKAKQSSHRYENSNSDLVHENRNKDTTLDDTLTKPKSTAKELQPSFEVETSRTVPDQPIIRSNRGILKRNSSHRSTSDVNILGRIEGGGQNNTLKSSRHQTEDFTLEEASNGSIQRLRLQNILEEKDDSMFLASPLQKNSEESESRLTEAHSGKEYSTPSTSRHGVRTDSDANYDGIFLEGGPLYAESSRKKFSLKNENVILNMGAKHVPVNQAIEITNIITDVIIIEVVTHMLHAGQYLPPSRRKYDKQSRPTPLVPSTISSKVKKSDPGKPLVSNASGTDKSKTMSEVKNDSHQFMGTNPLFLRHKQHLSRISDSKNKEIVSHPRREITNIEEPYINQTEPQYLRNSFKSGSNRALMEPIISSQQQLVPSRPLDTIHPQTKRGKSHQCARNSKNMYLRKPYERERNCLNLPQINRATCQFGDSQMGASKGQRFCKVSKDFKCNERIRMCPAAKAQGTLHQTVGNESDNPRGLSIDTPSLCLKDMSRQSNLKVIHDEECHVCPATLPAGHRTSLVNQGMNTQIESKLRVCHLHPRRKQIPNESGREIQTRSRSLSPSSTQSTRHVTCKLEEERLRKKLTKVICRLEEQRIREKLFPVRPFNTTCFQVQEYIQPNKRSLNARTPSISRDENTGANSNRIRPIVSVCELVNSKELPSSKPESVLYFTRLTENAFPPSKESYRTPGFMLKSAYDYLVPARGMVVVKTDLRVELPPNSYGRIAPRRHLGEHFMIGVGSDVFGQGEDIVVLLFNHSDKTFHIKRGNKVAQLICESSHCSAVREYHK